MFGALVFEIVDCMVGGMSAVVGLGVNGLVAFVLLE